MVKVMTFDIQQAPPTKEAIEAERNRLEQELGKWWYRLGRTDVGGWIVAIGGLVNLGMLAQQEFVEGMPWILVALSIVGQLALLVFIIGQLFIIDLSTERKVMELSSLRWLDPEKVPGECLSLGEWCGKDETVRAYLDKIAAQGRKPVVGEYEAAEDWMAEARRRAIDRELIEKARQACERMGVV